MKYDSIVLGPLRSNCYVIYDENTNDAIVVDVGGEPSELIEYVKNKNLKVHYIIITHSHFDHILGIEKFKEWSGAKVVANENAPELLIDPEKNLSTVGYCDNVSIKADILVSDMQELKAGSIDVRFFHTPGHTPCAMCIEVGDLLCTGDTLFKGTMGRCDLYGGSLKTMYKTLFRIYNFEKNYTILPGHEDSTTLDYERENNRYLRMGKEKANS